MNVSTFYYFTYFSHYANLIEIHFHKLRHEGCANLPLVSINAFQITEFVLRSPPDLIAFFCINARKC